MRSPGDAGSQFSREELELLRTCAYHTSWTYLCMQSKAQDWLYAEEQCEAIKQELTTQHWQLICVRSARVHFQSARDALYSKL